MAINIKVDKERLSTSVTIDEYLALIEGDVKTMVSVLSMFVIGDDGAYLEKSEGRKIIGKLTLDEMNRAVSAFTDGAERTVVPPTSGAA